MTYEERKKYDNTHMRSTRGYDVGVAHVDVNAVSGVFDDVEIMDLIRRRLRLALKEAYESVGCKTLENSLTAHMSERAKASIYRQAAEAYVKYHFEDRIPAHKQYLARFIRNTLLAYGLGVLGECEDEQFWGEEYFPPIFH